MDFTLNSHHSQLSHQRNTSDFPDDLLSAYDSQDKIFFTLLKIREMISTFIDKSES